MHFVCVIFVLLYSRFTGGQRTAPAINSFRRIYVSIGMGSSKYEKIIVGVPPRKKMLTHW